MKSRAVSLADLGPEARKQAHAQFLADDARSTANIMYALGLPVPKRSKYHAVATWHTSIYGVKRLYHSKAEANYAAFLDGEVKRGSVLWYIPQVPIPLPGGVKWYADFLVVTPHAVTLVDIKGLETAMFKLKRKQIKALYGIDVEVVKVSRRGRAA